MMCRRIAAPVERPCGADEMEQVQMQTALLKHGRLCRPTTGIHTHDSAHGVILC
jgi:hypothetical protein